MIKIAIITLNYNGKEDTIEFLGSLNKLDTRGFEIKTIVLDNASGDGSIRQIRKLFPDVDILQTGVNLGFAGGFNKGIDYGLIWGADYVLIINNDSLIKDSNLLPELVSTFEKNPRVGMVSPRIYFAPRFEYHKEKYADLDRGRVIWYAGGSFDWNNIRSIHRGLDEVDTGQYDKVEEVELVSGACMFVKREVFEKVGLFDERYFLYFEDTDFCRRVLLAGYKKIYNGAVAIFHKVSQSTGIGSEVTDYFHTRNRLLLALKYAGWKTKFALIREAVKLLIRGRSAQKEAIGDLLRFTKKVFPSEEKGGIEYSYKLSIGIVNYQTADLTKKLLQSVIKEESGFNEKDMEIIVLDNGSKDNLKESIKDYLPKVKLLENRENEGFSRGYNKLIRFSLGEYFLMLNSDIEVLPGALTELIKVEDLASGEAVLGGKLYFPDKSKQDSCFHLPTITGAFKEYFLSQKGAYFMYLPRGKAGQPPSSKPVRVEGMVMAVLLIPKKVMNKVGLLDESTFIYFEDIEYARRLKKFGISAFFVPSAKFIHHHGASSRTIGVKKSYSLLQKAARRYHGLVYYIILSVVLLLGQKFGKVKTPVSRWTSI